MRKNIDRFNGVSEQELYERSLPDVIENNLDIVFVNIYPGLYSVYKQHHYAGPGNHFWRCLHESGLTNRVLKSFEDFKLLEYRIGLVNMNEKPSTKTCQDMSQDEIKQSQMNLIKKIKLYKPKIVAFNGKSIFEIYTGSSVSRDFNFGKQSIRFDETETIQFVLPSSSARCSQLPKVVDKVPFYSALKKLRDHLNGNLASLSDDEIMFPDFKVALDSKGLNETQNESDVDSDDDLNGDDNLEDDVEAKNGHRIRFVRLNNLPYSQLPANVLEDLKKKKESKKSVTITTNKDYFNVMKKNLNKDVASVTSNDDTCDSDYGTASSCSLNEEPASKISSLILNVCNSNSNQTITPVVKTPTPVTQIRPKTLIQIRTPDSASNTNKKIKVLLSEASSQLIQKANSNCFLINNKIAISKQPVVVLNNSQQLPVQIQIQKAPVNQQNELIKQLNKPVQMVNKIDENTLLVDFELVKKDQYSLDDYYKFEPTLNYNHQNPLYFLTDEYLNNTKNDLYRTVKLCYGNETNRSQLSQEKRFFSSINDANSFILANQKHICFIDLNKL